MTDDSATLPLSPQLSCAPRNARRPYDVRYERYDLGIFTRDDRLADAYLELLFVKRRFLPREAADKNFALNSIRCEMSDGLR